MDDQVSSMDSDELNYHHLRLFRAVVRAGSVAAAARELHLTPQTVSEQVAALERTLGTVLLDRSGRAVAPTETGRLVATCADGIFERGRELVELVRQRGEAPVLRVVVGVSDVMPKLVVHRLLRPVHALGPHVRVVCREDRTDRLLAALAVHDVDVVLADAPTPPHLRLRTFDHLLGASDALLVAAPALARTLRPGFPRSTDGAPLLLPGHGTVLRSDLLRWADSHGVHPVWVAEFDDSALAKEAAADGLGAMAAPSIIAPDLRRRFGLRPVGALDPVVERFYAISPERRIAHPAVAALAAGASGALGGGA